VCSSDLVLAGVVPALLYVVCAFGYVAHLGFWIFALEVGP
jgi:hypothetical protein